MADYYFAPSVTEKLQGCPKTHFAHSYFHEQIVHRSENYNVSAYYILRVASISQSGVEIKPKYFRVAKNFKEAKSPRHGNQG